VTTLELPGTCRTHQVDQANEEKCENPCVLLVDDDLAVRRSIKLFLSTKGYEVRDFGSGAELLACRKRAPYRCLITDFVMPAMDGLTLLARLRATGWSAPSILITGCYQKDLERRALDAGFSALVEKPLTDEKLLGVITHYLGTPPSAS
jgi:two-component system response regulator FixJ